MGHANYCMKLKGNVVKSDYRIIYHFLNFLKLRKERELFYQFKYRMFNLLIGL